MATQATQTAIDSGKIVERLLQRVSKSQLTQLVDAAAEHSGHVVSGSGLEEDAPLCPTFRFPHPLPHGIGQFLTEASRLGSVKIFPHGIISPEAMMVQVRVGQMER